LACGAPLRGALEQRERPRAIHDRRRDLHRRRAGTDHTDARTLERNRVIPAGAVEGVPRERVEAFDLGVARAVEHTGGRDHHVDLVSDTARCRELPAAVATGAAHHLVPEADLAHDVVTVRDPFEVRLDLAGEPVTPRGSVRVDEVRKEGTAGTRIGVLPPGTAEPLGLLVDREVLEARLAQPDRAEDARHPGADDREAKLAPRFRRGSFDHRVTDHAPPPPPLHDSNGRTVVELAFAPYHRVMVLAA
jgi:hypothetical protein